MSIHISSAVAASSELGLHSPDGDCPHPSQSPIFVHPYTVESVQMHFLPSGSVLSPDDFPSHVSVVASAHVGSFARRWRRITCNQSPHSVLSHSSPKSYWLRFVRAIHESDFFPLPEFLVHEHGRVVLMHGCTQSCHIIGERIHIIQVIGHPQF